MLHLKHNITTKTFTYVPEKEFKVSFYIYPDLNVLSGCQGKHFICPNIWDNKIGESCQLQITGKMKIGESPEQAIQRECFEETGFYIELKDIELKGVSEYKYLNKKTGEIIQYNNNVGLVDFTKCSTPIEPISFTDAEDDMVNRVLFYLYLPYIDHDKFNNRIYSVENENIYVLNRKTLFREINKKKQYWKTRCLKF